jgi:predicted dehydrogenase
VTGHADREQLGAVVVGTGFGVLTHVRALRQANFQVRSLVGRDPVKTADRAQRFDIPHACTSLADALALDGVDAVTVATPPHTHAAIVLEAVAAGKHVVCEKPFARDGDEAQQMLEASERADVVHMLGTEFRFATGQAFLARTIAQRAIGEPRFATFILHTPLIAEPSAEVPAWWERQEEGGGWLGAYASHQVDRVQYMLGAFDGVSASLQTVRAKPMTADDTYTIHFRLTTGAVGILQSTAGAWGPPVSITRVIGSRGTAWQQGDEVFVADADGTRQLPVPDDLLLPAPVPPPGDLLVTAYDMMHSMGIDLAPYTKLFAVFRDRILGRPVAEDPPPATFADGVACMRVFDAIHRSSAEHCWVSVDR